MAASFQLWLDGRPVVVRGDQRPFLNRLQPVAVHMAKVELTFDLPGDLAVRLQCHDPHGDVVEAERVIVESLAVHVHHERVADRC